MKANFKKILCLILAILFALSVAACGGNGGTSSDDKGSSSQTSGPIEGQVTSGGIQEASVDSALIEKSELANKNYGGKEYQFYYWYAPNEITTRKVSEFNKKHNANVKITVGSSFQEDIAKSIAGGKPYDMIANHARYFPQTIFANLYEPLGDYIKDVDYFDSAKPENGGISKTLNETFTWNGKLYAAGSAKAVYSYAFYYNKKKYKEDGLEDPYELWKKGEWTWEKMMEQGRQVTNVAENITFLNQIELHPWLALHGLSYIKKTGENTFAENLGDKDVVAAINSYKDLQFADEPIMVWNAKQLSWYANITYTDAYTQIATQVRTSTAFGRKASNLGVVPVPTNQIAGNKYPTHVAQGYSVARGAKDPSIAPCYALFESRISDKDVGSDIQMPAEIRNAIDDAFANNGFCPVSGFADSEGRYAEETVNRQIGIEIIANGADVASTLTAQRPVITAIITAALSGAQNFKG